MNSPQYHNFVRAAERIRDLSGDKVRRFVRDHRSDHTTGTDKVRRFVPASAHSWRDIRDKVRHFVCLAHRSGKYLADKDVYTKRLWLAIIYIGIIIFPNSHIPGIHGDPNFHVIEFTRGMMLLIIMIVCTFYIIIFED